MRYYYTNESNQSCGPVEEHILHELYKAGVITPNSSIIEEGGTDWIKYETHYGVNSSEKIATHTNPEVTYNASPPPPNKSSTPNAKEKVQAASKDALQAFKILVTDPVNGLLQVFDSLGDKRARSVGLIFGLCFALSVVFLFYNKFLSGTMTLEIAFKVFLASLVPYIGFTVGCAVPRMITGKGSLCHDSFVGGVALLPITLLILIGSFLGIGNIEIVLILTLFSFCLTVLMIFFGLTRVSKISERVATIAVPVVILIALWASKIIYAEVIEKYAIEIINSYPM